MRRRKSRLMKLIALWAAKILAKKVVVSKPFKNHNVLIHSPLLAFPST